MASKISTFRRFVYLNSYAYLLLFAGIGIAFIPLYRVHWILAIPHIAVVLVLVDSAIKILSRWKSKKRSYNILIERNREEICIDSFKEYMQAPCGRLLVRVVLTDLGKKEEYRTLKKKFIPTLREHFKMIKKAMKPQRTVIYIAGEDKASR